MLGILIAVSVTRLIAKSIRGSLKLAQRSSQMAREIEVLIAESVTRVDEDSVLAEDVDSTMHDIVMSIRLALCRSHHERYFGGVRRAESQYFTNW
ncbi:MAG: hypothetical protein ACR5LD_03465 [Symbiopectobacterium sp.]